MVGLLKRGEGNGPVPAEYNPVVVEGVVSFGIARDDSSQSQGDRVLADLRDLGTFDCSEGRNVVVTR